MREKTLPQAKKGAHKHTGCFNCFVSVFDRNIQLVFGNTATKMNYAEWKEVENTNQVQQKKNDNPMHYHRQRYNFLIGAKME